jgi:hypothetical protein
MSVTPEPTPPESTRYFPLPEPPLRDNRKKVALRYVLDSISEAVQDLGADFIDTGATSPSESLVNGLGGDGSVWKSALAEKMRADITETIRKITSCLSSEKEKVSGEWSNEPDLVDRNDPRAKWRTQ